MAGQPDRRQQFRFWYPFWGTGTAASSRTAAPAPRPTPKSQPKSRPGTQMPTPPVAPPPDQSQPIKRTSRTPSPSPSSSPSPSPSSSSPSKQNQRRVSRTPSPSPTQSPSRRSSRSEEVKQIKTKEESTQSSRPPPSPSQGAAKSVETSNQQGITQEEKIADKEPIEPEAQDSKTVEGNLDRSTDKASDVENGSKNSEKLESKSTPFHPPPIDDKRTETVSSNINPSETHGEKGEENQVGLKPSTIQEVSQTQLEEKKQTQKEADQEKSIPDINREKEQPEENIKDITTSSKDDKPEETIKEIAKPSVDETLKEPIKEVAQPSETPTMNNNNSSNKSSIENENPVVNNLREKEKIVPDPGSARRASFQKDIKDGISKLAQKITTENSLNLTSESGTSIVTLAGENKGASMYIGHENESTAESSKVKEEIEIEKIEKDSKISANVNSNVQSINNSMLHESRCDTRDPGVHLRLSSRMKKEKMKKREVESSN